MRAGVGVFHGIELLVIAPAPGATELRASVHGQILGIAGDTCSQVFGAFGALGGMPFGYVVMNVGVRIPARNV